MKSKCAVYTGANKDFEIREVEVSNPPKGYALLELRASGICGTDIHIHNGKIPIGDDEQIIGHEFAGEVVGLNVDGECDLKVGDKGLVYLLIPCNECRLCKLGESANCLNPSVTNKLLSDEPHLCGGYTEYNFAPVDNVIKIPDEIPYETVAVFPCAGPTVIHSLDAIGNLDYGKISTAVVQGLGPIGSFAVLYLKKMGVDKVICVTGSKNPTREKIAKEFGADRVLYCSENSDEEILDIIMQETDGVGADLVLEGSGNPHAFTQGIDFLRNCGIYSVPGQYSNSGGVTINPEKITFKALKIIGAAQYAVKDIEDYLKFLLDNKDCWGKINAVCTHKWKIEDANKAFDTAKKGESVKAVFVK